MEGSLIPQNNATDNISQSHYQNLLSKSYTMILGKKQSFRCIYERVHEHLSFSQQIELKNLPNCKFTFEAKIVCKECHHFRMLLRSPLYLCACQNVAYLRVTITNLGIDVKVNLNISIEKNDFVEAHIQNVDKYLKKNENHYVDWKFIPNTRYGPVISLNEDNTYEDEFVYGSVYFSEMGNLTILCDMKLLELKNEAKVENYEPPSILKTLAEHFSKANVNPATPPKDLLTDIILCIGENKIYCHKLILGMSSNFFKAMFTTNMKESKSQKIELKNVEVDLETVENMISFMYENRIDDVKITADLLAIADMYEVLRLRNICSEKLQRALNDENVAKIWHTAYLHNVEELAHAATIFMVKRWKALSKDDAVRELCEKYPKLLFTISTLLADIYQDSMAFNNEESMTKRLKKE